MPDTAGNVVLGDNDAPVLTDPAKIAALLDKVARPTHEPIQFLRRRGSASPADEAHYVRIHSPESLQAMHDLGIRLPKRFHFYKGFGLERERAEIDKTVKVAEWLHAHGMKISVYVGGTMFSDSFFLEVPEAVNWMRRDQYGQPVTYSGFQLWRYFPCLNNPDYLDYTRRVLDVAVDEVRADEIFFDNQILRHEPRSCRCEHCVRHFRDYIRRTYSLDELERRYGYREVGLVNPPVWSQACKPEIYNEIPHPDVQDWIAHRTRTVLDFYRAMADHVHAKNPAVVVGLNIKGVHAHNRALDNGVDHNLLGSEGKLQFSCLDSGQAHCRMLGKARVSEWRTFKAANSVRIHFTAGEGSDLGISEFQVFTYRPFYDGYGWAGSMDGAGNFSPLAQFFRMHQHLFRGRRHVYEIGVLRSSASMNFSNRIAHENVYPVEETLFNAKLPLGLVFDSNMYELDGYKVIVAAEQRGLSNEWIAALLKFVENGGGVVFTGGTGMYDGWYRPRTGGTPAHGLEPFFGEVPGASARRKLGRGRVAYIPALDLPYTMDRGDWPDLPLGKILPLDDEKPLLDAVKWVCPAPFTVSAAGPAPVAMEVVEGDRPGALSIHFVNYDPKKKGRLNVKLVLPASGRKPSARLLLPAKARARSYAPPPPKTLALKVSGKVASFSLPVPEVYACVTVE
ncbi:MAG: beta-galactosidase [Planctomycetes bacterium]|nr:beta-galactosidase [Planctomycetota bacterium]